MNFVVGELLPGIVVWMGLLLLGRVTWEAIHIKMWGLLAFLPPIAGGIVAMVLIMAGQ